MTGAAATEAERLRRLLRELPGPGAEGADA
ncbi:hypothetical protein SAMN06272781_2683 [Streptomyces sp. 1222.2]|uniref:Uncharacterized protein n=1 Tax=Streptomyces stelliscabiei TaxID=146820 RepID=A0A8I0TUN2_9ACTN|nr:hypothetical protein [Streptomyces stelliscabiei]SOD70372.1 hypothetical protein SAMN06272781_2683 [Streptomyces sp. 1222.2]